MPLPTFFKKRPLRHRVQKRAKALWRKVLDVVWDRLKRTAKACARFVVAFARGTGRLGEQIAEMPMGFAALLLAIGVVLIIGAGWMLVGRAMEIGAHETSVIVGGIVDAINKLVDAGESLVSWIPGVKHHLKSDPLGEVHSLDPYKNLGTICHHFHSTTNVVLYIPQLICNKHVCPVQRYTFETGLWPVTGWLLAWGYLDARPNVGNCAITSADTFCFAANGWRAWLLLIPLMLIGYLMRPYYIIILPALDAVFDIADMVIVVFLLFLQRFLFPSKVVLPATDYHALKKQAMHIMSTGL